MARRAWVIDQIAAKFPDTPRLIVDSGNFSDNPTPAGLTKTRALLEGMERLGYAVVNVGERDIRQGYGRFAETTAGRKLSFVSANIVRAGSERPVFEPSLVVEGRAPDGGRSLRIGVIGVVRFNPLFRRPGPDPAEEMVIVHPRPAIEREVARLRQQKVDLVVLLAALHRDDARRLVAEVPGIDFVVGSYGGLFTTRRESEGQTWLLYAGNQGKRLGETRVFLGDESVDQKTRLHLLTSVYPDDEKMVRFLETVPRETEAAPPTVGAIPEKPETGSFTGSTTCRTCHVDEAAQWATTAHAHALDTLEGAGKADDRRCLTCHAVGPRASDGFRSRQATPHLANVGCESCHGPGREHVQNPRASYGTVKLATCTACHDAENSPGFDFYAALARVDHRGDR